MTVEIHETSRIAARILEPDGTPGSASSARRSTGKDTSAVVNFAGPGLRISVPAAGTYVLTVVACKDDLSGSRRSGS